MDNRPKIYVVGNDWGYQKMFVKNGWLISDNPDDADAIQFTGGADVDPMLYCEPKHPTTNSSPSRDSLEAHIFHTYEGEKPMFGICRGGQFLCVMSGGRMWQDVDNHAVGGTHDLVDLETGEIVPVSSTHHQMMDPSTADAYEILAVAGRSTRKSDGWGNNIVVKNPKEDNSDVEAVFFPNTGCLSYQPHPEFFDPDHPCQKFYFDLIKRHFNLGA